VSVQAGGAGLRPLARIALAMRVALLASEERVDELEGLLHPDLYVPSVPGVAPGKGFRGREGFERYFAEAASAGFKASAEIFRSEVTGAGNVFASGELTSTLRGQVEVVSAWFVYRFRDGQVSAIETYTDRDTAWAQAQATTA
jgi:ketosteroid isomerase-like protein